MRGTLDSIFVASGDIDVCVVADLPENETVAAAALAVNQSSVATAKVVVLMTPEEVDKAAKKSVNDRPAGANALSPARFQHAVCSC